MEIEGFRAVPISVTNFIPIPIHTFSVTPAPPGAGALAVSYVQQTENNWCWAACGEMLFGALGPAPWSQCSLASSEFNLVCCPSPRAPWNCDNGAWPDIVYSKHGLPTNRVTSALTPAQVRAELAVGKPVQVMYQWTGGNQTHVALIVGEHPNGDFEVFDPWRSYGHGPRQYSQILNAYGLGNWIWTFTF